MTKTLTALLLALASATSLQAQKPWKVNLKCPEQRIYLNLDLYEESIEVPTMEMFGPMNGYMDGNIYGVWSITSCEVKDDKTAIINLSNDLGSETQKALLTHDTDSTWTCSLQGLTVIKRVTDKRKLVKIPSELVFKKN